MSEMWIGFLILIIVPYMAMGVHLVWARREIDKRWDEWFEILLEE